PACDGTVLAGGAAKIYAGRPEARDLLPLPRRTGFAGCGCRVRIQAAAGGTSFVRGLERPMNQIDLNGQVAVITGGAQGIGFAIASRLVKSGAKVSLWDMRDDVLKQAVAELGAAASSQMVNIADYDQVANAVAETEKLLGRIDILVNSAGIAGKNAPLDEY